MRYIFLISLFAILTTLSVHAEPDENKDKLSEGKVFPKLTLKKGKEELILPDDFKGKPFVVYFGNVANEDDAFQFLSWGGAFTISLRQSDEILHDVYFTGVVSLRYRPIYWMMFVVKCSTILTEFLLRNWISNYTMSVALLWMIVV